MKKIHIILIALVLLFISGCSENANNYEPVHCVFGNREKNDSIELFFDFKDKQVYRYSIFTVSKYNENINFDNYVKMTNNVNQKYVGAMGKV